MSRLRAAALGLTALTGCGSDDGTAGGGEAASQAVIAADGGA